MDGNVIEARTPDARVRLHDAEHTARLDVRPLTVRIGAEVLGVDLTRPLPEETVSALRTAITKYQVIFFREQELDPDGLKRFGRYFGELEPHSAAKNIPGHPEIIAIHADANSKYVAGETWHSDSTCNEIPPMGTVLNLHTIPPLGGDTVFSSMYEAYDALSPAMQAFLEPLTAVHDGEFAYRRYANMEVEGTGSLKSVFPATTHPVIRTHPVTKRKAIFVNEAFVTRIVELDESESRQVLSFIFEHVKNANFQCRFRWRRHSMAFWDNRCVQHLAVRDYHPEVRSGLRINIAGTAPV